MPVTIDPDELRRRHKAWWKEFHRVDELRRELMLTGATRHADYFFEHGVWLPLPVMPAYPEYPPECEGMVCGAWGRQRQRPCQRKELFENGRCKNHGGPSTGPKSPEGKARSAANLRGVPE